MELVDRKGILHETKHVHDSVKLDLPAPVDRELHQLKEISQLLKMFNLMMKMRPKKRRIMRETMKLIMVTNLKMMKIFSALLMKGMCGLMMKLTSPCYVNIEILP